MDPSVLLLDEPFGALDAAVRKSLRRELRRIHDATGVTTVFVTHDQAEALSVADRVGVLRAGRLEQVATEQEVKRTTLKKYRSALSTLYTGFVSNIENVDMGTAITQLNENQTALQAALAVTAQLNQVSLLNYMK